MQLATVGAATLLVDSTAVARSVARKRIRVGYRPTWSGREIDARWLPTGDASRLAEGVRLTVFGVPPLESSWRGHAAIDVHFGQAASDAVFHAWSGRNTEEVGLPAPTSIRVPVTEGFLRVDVSWDARSTTVDLSLGNEVAAPKLRTGYYLFNSPARPALVVRVDPIDTPPSAATPWRLDRV